MKAKRERITYWVISKAVHDIGIPANIIGYYHMIEAVKIAVDNETAVSGITKNIYATVAERFCTTARRVSDSIARAIAIGWERAELYTLDSYFGHDAYNAIAMPASEECIRILAERVRLTCEKTDVETAFSEQAIASSNIKNQDLATRVLNELAVPVHLKGFHYLADAIALAIDDIDIVFSYSLSKVLYQIIADRYNTTPGRVEYAIRYAIEACWDLGDLDALKSWFEYTVSPWKGKPSNGEFIAMIADTIRRRLD